MKFIQEEKYPDEIPTLQTNKLIPNDSTLFNLNPLLSEKGLLLVRRRVQNANLALTLKHPIELPSNHLLVKMIIYDAHEK
ncbi:hypothetical protein NPIL_377011, partial [Nephila pilipes]